MWEKIQDDNNRAVNRCAHSENGKLHLGANTDPSHARTELTCVYLFFWMFCGILESLIFMDFPLCSKPWQANEKYEERENNVNHEFEISASHTLKGRNQSFPFQA